MTSAALRLEIDTAVGNPGMRTYVLPGMTWADFDANSSLERDVLERALELPSLQGSSDWYCEIDWEADRASYGVTLHETLGATPGGCVDLLGIRPLLAATAWKVLDLLVEEAMQVRGQPPIRLSIKDKAAAAPNLPMIPPFTAQSQSALMLTYVNTVEIRHSLIHRTVTTDSAGSLIGTPSGPGVAPVLTSDEQTALGRCVLRASNLVIRGVLDRREELALQGELSRLSKVHGLSFGAPGDVKPIRTVRIVLDASSAGTAVVDVAKLRGHRALGGDQVADVQFAARDAPAEVLRGRLEDAPDGTVTIDFNSPPPWLHR